LKKYAVILAGGFGTRMGAAVPKQFLPLHGKPVLTYTLETFLKAFNDLEIILVIAADYLEMARAIIQTLDGSERILLTEGGQTRFHSVKKGVQHIGQPSIVFIHDAVRCLLSANLIHRCYEMALEHGNAIPAVQAVDSVRIETIHGNESLNRAQVKLIQTPQTFQSEVIKAAFEQEYDPAFTDEASLVERLGVKINLVDGELTNIKITRPFDILIAEKILQENHFI